MITGNDCESLQKVWNGSAEIYNFIDRNLPGISVKDRKRIHDDFIYHQVPLEVSANRYIAEKQVEKWNKSKSKKYYFVSMLNGGTKVLYMCKEHVEAYYHGRYKEI